LDFIQVLTKASVLLSLVLSLAIMKRTIFVSFLVTLLSLAGSVAYGAETWRDGYFMGEGIRTLSNGTTLNTVYLLEKLVRPEEGWFSEEALIVYPSGCINSGKFKMDVTGNTFKISHDFMTGKGDLSGVSWQWSYFKLDAKMNSGAARILIEDFMASPSILSARKTVSNVDGSVVYETWDISLREIPKSSFEILRNTLLPQLQTNLCQK